MPSSGQVGRIVTMRPPQIKYISPLPTVQKNSRISDKSNTGINVTIDFIYDTIGSIQYSRALFTPGCGTGYFPSPPANSGAGINFSPFHGLQNSLSIFIYDQAGSASKYAPARAWTAALTLVALVLTLTIAAKLLSRRNKLR